MARVIENEQQGRKQWKNKTVSCKAAHNNAQLSSEKYGENFVDKTKCDMTWGFSLILILSG